MRLDLFCKGIALATVMALIYISIQMNIIDLAYQGKKNEKRIQALLEENSHLAYNIFEMKSASHIGHRLLEDNELTFASKKEVVEVEAPEMRPSAIQVSSLDNQGDQNILGRLLTLVSSPAEAQQ